MKRILVLFLAIILTVGLAGCGGESPEQAVKNAFDAIKSNNSEAASKYMDYDELLNAGEDSEDKTEGEVDDDSKEMAELILQHFDYKIISSSEDGDSATVKAEISNLDMRGVLADFISQAFALAFSDLDEEEMDQQLHDKFVELMNSEGREIVTKTVDIKLTKGEEGWKINMSDELGDAIFGGMLSVAKDMNEEFGE